MGDINLHGDVESFNYLCEIIWGMAWAKTATMFHPTISSARMRPTLLIRIGNEAVKRCNIWRGIAPVTFSLQDQGVKASQHCSMLLILRVFSVSQMCEGKKQTKKTYLLVTDSFIQLSQVKLSSEGCMYEWLILRHQSGFYRGPLRCYPVVVIGGGGIQDHHCGR